MKITIRLAPSTGPTRPTRPTRLTYARGVLTISGTHARTLYAWAKAHAALLRHARSPRDLAQALARVAPTLTPRPVRPTHPVFAATYLTRAA